MKFDYIALIYNPKSTGNAPALAKKLASQIAENHEAIGVKATLTPTEHAGHARTLANDISLKYSHPLIVSISGDGGYNEVINGVMDAQLADDKTRPVTATVGAGNANDHKRMTRGKLPLISLIVQNEPQPLDILRLEASHSSSNLVRYAHSYIGLGISPKIGYELNMNGKTAFHEAWTVLKTFWSFEPFELVHNGSRVELDSIVFANISEMAKVLKLEPETDVQNNQFRIVIFTHQSKLKLLFILLKSIFMHATSYAQASKYQCTTVDSQLIQLDGEIEELAAHTKIIVSSHSSAIQSLYVHEN